MALLKQCSLALVYTHHRRCGPEYYRRAARRVLGLSSVCSWGPWKDEEPFGTYGREPDYDIPYGRVEWEFDEIASSVRTGIDALILVDGGEHLKIHNIPDHLPWAHISTEGSMMDWSIGKTPHRYAEIMCNGVDDGVKWLPKAFDRHEMNNTIPLAIRDYDLVQFASARDGRRMVWEEVPRKAPDLHTQFGDIWGPLYWHALENARTTWVCSSIDFVTTRVFEAMANGCLVIADRTPSMSQLFEEGVHYLAYDDVPGPGGEGIPNVDWLIEQVRHIKKRAVEYEPMRAAAYEEVVKHHSYEHRILRVLRDLGFAR
jgi:glycosyltransferase involved in cell wall biosynthesis